MFRPPSSRVFGPGGLRTLSQRLISKTQRLPFTQDQQCQVLTLLNNGSQIELRKFMGATTLQRVLEHREQHGTFTSFESLFSIEGLRFSNLQNFCNKILCTQDKSLAMTKAIVPSLSLERREGIEVVASINLDLPFMTYVKMDRNFNVLEWQRFLCVQESARKSRASLNCNYSLALTCYPKLPQADIFIMEKQEERGQPGTNINLDKTILQSMLYTMLSFGEPEQPKVVQIKLPAISSYFGLNIGSEMVSCQDTFQQLVDSHQIKLPEKLSQQYLRRNSVDREFIGLNTLHCVAFLKAISLDFSDRFDS